MQRSKLTRHRKVSGKSRGAALVEMAIAMLVLIPLTFGLLEFGWIMYKLSQVNLAAQRCSRCGASGRDYDGSGKCRQDAHGHRRYG